MSLRLNQEFHASGYITESKSLYGTVGDFETNLGYHHGRLRKGFFIAHLLTIPDLDDFELAGYSITPQHRFKLPSDLDITVLKKLARDKMLSIGHKNLIKVFPAIRHNTCMDSDEQYPYGQGGVAQWNLTRELPMYIFREIEAGYSGTIYL